MNQTAKKLLQGVGSNPAIPLLAIVRVRCQKHCQEYNCKLLDGIKQLFEPSCFSFSLTLQLTFIFSGRFSTLILEMFHLVIQKKTQTNDQGNIFTL